MAASLLFTSRLSSRSLPAAWFAPRPVCAAFGSTRPSSGLGQAVPRQLGRGVRVAAPAGTMLPEAAMPTVPLVLVGLLVLLAVLVAPERPLDQAAICQRHAGPEACRVW
jgi:hypothetical protein